MSFYLLFFIFYFFKNHIKRRYFDDVEYLNFHVIKLSLYRVEMPCVKFDGQLNFLALEITNVLNVTKSIYETLNNVLIKVRLKPSLRQLWS